MRAIPVPIRLRILQLYDHCESTVEIAEALGFCVAAVRRVRPQFKARGTLQPQTHLCGRKTLLRARRQARLQKLLAAQPDATLAELGAQLDRPFGPSTVDRWRRRLKLSYKKTRHAAEQQRPDVARQRARWHKDLQAEPAARRVFVDESGAHPQMTRWRGRGAVGPRLVAPVPHGHDQTSTLIAAVRLTGACAPWVWSGAMNGPLFLAWVRQGLAPTLRPEDLVIRDNLATHKVAGGRAAIAAVGARRRYLPPYSPDFNPIENLWSKVKQKRRRLAPRTDPALVRAGGIAFAAISTTDCQGFFSHARYAT